MPERGKLWKLFDSTELMCDAFLQSFLILVSSPLVSPPYPQIGNVNKIDKKIAKHLFASLEKKNSRMFTAALSVIPRAPLASN